MSYELLPHTADIRLKVSAKTLDELFSEALAGMMDIAVPTFEKSAVPTQRHISVSAPDRSALLIDFLNEALSLSQIYKEAYTGAFFEHLSETELKAELEGKTAVFNEDIKAVTYHGAEIAKNNRGEYEVTILFDI